MGLEFGESHFDWIEVGAVGRQEQQPGAGGADCGVCCWAFVAAEIIHNDNVARPENGDELRLHPGLEDGAVHGRIDDEGCDETIALEACNERLGFPVAEGSLGVKPVCSGAAPAQACQLGCCACFVYKNQPVPLTRHEWLAAFFPFRTRLGDVRPVLFRCPQGFF